jgi:hypothetical protein
MTTPNQQALAAIEDAKTLTAKGAVQLLEAAAQKQDDEVAFWGCNESLVSMVQQDASDLRYIATQISEERLEGAMAAAGQMDTAARDLIPMAVWVFMGGELIHG